MMMMAKELKRKRKDIDDDDDDGGHVVSIHGVMAFDSVSFVHTN